MKGVVFGLLEQCVLLEHGDDGWDAALEAAGSDGVYTSLGEYPDADLARLVAEVAALRGEDPDKTVRWLGRKGLPLLAETYPHLFARHADARSFVLSLNDIIHPEVRKRFPGADAPTFDIRLAASDRVVLAYTSARVLCRFAEGLLLGSGDHFGERVTVEQPECRRDGAEHCVLDVRFAP